MGTVTLDDSDEAVLERLREGPADVDSLAARVDCPAGYLRDRLPELADNGLVRATGADEYELTDSGERVLAGSPAGTLDDRIDTPQAVEDRLDSLDLRPDREEAVRNAFAFLRYWGVASTGEVIDAVYSENPAGYESRSEWWEACVRDRLAALPRVDAPDGDADRWRYEGEAIAADDADDGRLAPDDEPVVGNSAAFALRRRDLDEPERDAVRAAFDALVAEGELGAGELRERVRSARAAGDAADRGRWTDRVGDALASLPGVERPDDPEGTWRYRQDDDGRMTTNPGAEPPDPAGGDGGDRGGE